MSTGAARTDAARTDSAVTLATICAGVMIAHQVGAKATRDAMFLSSFEVTSLPLMVIFASVISMIGVMAASRAMTAFGPARFIPALFAISAGLLLGQWALVGTSTKGVAVSFYLHMAMIGSVLISGFWSVVNERFDPRTAKQRISRIVGGATFGGLIGGLAAERVGAYLSVSSMIPALAAMHLACGFMLSRLGPPASPPSKAKDKPPSGLALVAKKPYLRNLALLATFGTISAGFLDYVFKAEAASAYSDESLMRFFAVFYTVVGLVTFLVQTTLGRTLLEKYGLAKTTSALPVSVASASVIALISPTLATVGFARAIEGILRSSAFRSGYELFYTPVPALEKRATKSIIDVGFKRMGDAFGAGLVALTIWLLAENTVYALLGLAIGFSAVVVYIARRLHGGYVSELESSLKTRAIELDMVDLDESTTRSTVLKTMGAIDISEVRRHVAALGGNLESAGRVVSPNAAAQAAMTSAPPQQFVTPIPAARNDPSSAQIDAIVHRITELRSGDPRRVKAALRMQTELTPAIVPHVLPLMAWDEVSEAAIDALRRVAARVVGQLTDCIVDPNEEFTIRRRLPRVLCVIENDRAIAALFLALEDKRFEVRFQCGRALAILHAKNPALAMPRKEVTKAVLREVAVDKRVWESQRLLDEVADEEQDFVDAYLRDRSRRSLQHVFTLLSLTLDREPLQIAFRGLHTSDSTLRGTALEYLESVLPDEIRQSLWPFIEASEDRGDQRRTRDEILADLVRSNASIQMNLSELRKKHESG